MNAAKVTLTSTILAATLGLALGLMSAPAQAHCAGKHTGDHPHCTAGEDPIEYEAELTEGAFVFAPVNPVPVTPNQKEVVLRSNTTLDMDRPVGNPALQAAWDDVFTHCPEL